MLPIKEEEMITTQIENKTACQIMYTFKIHGRSSLLSLMPRRDKAELEKGSRKDSSSDQRLNSFHERNNKIVWECSAQERQFNFVQSSWPGQDSR